MIFKNKELLENTGTVLATGLASAPLALFSGSILGTLVKKVLRGEFNVNVANILSNISMVMYSLFSYYFYNPNNIKPAAVIAGIPLGTVTEISHAMSDRILKYRATGGIFLAHQEGGEVTLRIMGKAIGKNRFAFLSMMDLLFLYGSSKSLDLFTDKLQGIAEVTQLAPSTNPWKEFDKYSLDAGIEEKHLTFPVITNNPPKTYTNMYIETWEFTQSIENGMDVLNYSIFFRKYKPHYPYLYAETKDEQGVPIYFYKEDYNDDWIKKLRMFDTLADSLYSSAMIMYRFFQYLGGNSIERTIAHLSGLELQTALLGYDPTSETIESAYNIKEHLQELSTKQKEELMVID